MDGVSWTANIFVFLLTGSFSTSYRGIIIKVIQSVFFPTKCSAGDRSSIAWSELLPSQPSWPQMVHPNLIDEIRSISNVS